MTNYYILKDSKIALFDTDKQRLINTLQFMPEFSVSDILETERPIENFQFADTEEYQTAKAQNERQRLDSLSLTAADVERAIYKAKGMDFEDIVECVSRCQNGEAVSFDVGTTQATCDEAAQELCKDIDLKAFKIELKSNNFYRGNPYISQIGTLLGFSETQLDDFFETGNYEVLIDD